MPKIFALATCMTNKRFSSNNELLQVAIIAKFSDYEYIICKWHIAKYECTMFHVFV